jgi:hypothetical protein
LAFQGAITLGLGFIVEPERAHQLIDQDTRNADVLRPYLNGEDINARPDCTAPRWIIDFSDWSEHKAKEYRVCYDQVLGRVKPDRQTKIGYARSARERWWQFFLPRPALRKAIAGLDHVIVIARVSATVMPVMVPASQIFSEQIVVFASADTAMLGLLSSTPHYWWALSRGSTLGAMPLR